MLLMLAAEVTMGEGATMTDKKTEHKNKNKIKYKYKKKGFFSYNNVVIYCRLPLIKLLYRIKLSFHLSSVLLLDGLTVYSASNHILAASNFLTSNVLAPHLAIL